MYTLDYFIDKFERIPEENWYVGTYVNPNNPEQKCAVGHCNVMQEEKYVHTDEARALFDLSVKNIVPIYSVNDGTQNTMMYGDTPKLRVLNYLKSLKEKV